MVIDLRNISSIQQLHATLQQQLDFPAFYGNNWDALWDAITGLVDMPERLTLSGYAHFATAFPEEHKVLSRIVQDYNDRSGSKERIELA